MRQVSVRVAHGKAHVAIQCIADGCERWDMRHRASGVVKETHIFDVPSPEGRPRREYLICARCGRLYRVMVFCSAEVSVKSLDSLEEAMTSIVLADKKVIFSDLDESIGP